MPQLRNVSIYPLLVVLILSMSTPTFAASPATQSPNPAGNIVSSMNAGVLGPRLENQGQIVDGENYIEGHPILTRRAGIYGFTQLNESYTFLNLGSINVSGTNLLNVDEVYGMYAYATFNGIHNLQNSGSINVSGAANLRGMYAYANIGGHTLSNTGSGVITVTGTDVPPTLAADLYGMRANALYGSHKLTNKGMITVSGNNQIYGMHAFATYDGGHSLLNENTISVSGENTVYGMYANSKDGSHNITNRGAITAISASGGSTYGIHAYAESGNHIITSLGTIKSHGQDQVYGLHAYANNTGNHSMYNYNKLDIEGTATLHAMYAYAANGGHTLSNSESGIITVTGTDTPTILADDLYGMRANALYGSHRLTNKGIITVSGNNQIYGMHAFATYNGGHSLLNENIITASGEHTVYGIYANSKDGSHNITNRGAITAISASGGSTYGIHAYAESGNHIITSLGTINTRGQDQVYGLHAYANNTGNHKIYNYNKIDLEGTSTLYAMYTYAASGSHKLYNSSTLNVQGTNVVSGMHAETLLTGSSSITNDGDIILDGASQLYGMHALTTNNGSQTLTNNGTVRITGNDTLYGLRARAGNGSHTINNTGDINVIGVNNVVYGIHGHANLGAHTVSNSGSINVSGSDQVFGIYVGGAPAAAGSMHLINNTGIVKATATNTNPIAGAFEAFGDNNYGVGTWATTLRNWTNTSAVFGAGLNTTVHFSNAKLILRPDTAAQGFSLDTDYYVRDMVVANGTQGDANYISGNIAQAVTEVPFLKAVLSGPDPKTATVSLESNVNEDTTPSATALHAQVNTALAQFNNVSRSLNLQAYTDVIDALSAKTASMNEGMAAGSNFVESNWGAFLNPYANHVNNGEYNYNGGNMGITGGASYNINDSFSIGGHFDFNSANYYAAIMDMRSKSTSFALGMHSTYKILPQWYINGHITASTTTTDSSYELNNVTLMSANSTYNSEALYLGFNTGYIWTISEKHSLTPEIGLSYLSTHTADYDIKWDTGPSNFNIHHDDSYYKALYGNIVLNWRSSWTLTEDANISLLASLGLRQNLSGSNFESTLNTLGNDYTTRSTEDITTYLTSIGIEYRKDNFSVSLNYDGAYGIAQAKHGGKMMIKLEF